MENSKVISIDLENITFDNGAIMYSHHSQDCCEEHFLSFKDLELSDFDGLSFDLTSDKFFKRVPGFGIRLVPNNGHEVPIPGYGYNNGYYSSNLDLVIKSEDGKRTIYHISECQAYDDEQDYDDEDDDFRTFNEAPYGQD